jgi:thymidylate synthase
MEVREILNGGYTVPMVSYLDLEDRKINKGFMFKEAAWIISGSNRLSDITPHMARYADYSDDGVFLRGAYGPKIVDQLPYITETLASDKDSRQSVLTIWRERPGSSKDLPCTTQMQFLIRDNMLNSITTMRSQDIVLGFTYDVFTFSMVAKSVQLLLRQRGVSVGLGNLSVNAGSLHVYSTHYEKSQDWLSSNKRDLSIQEDIETLGSVETYEELMSQLNYLAKKNK